MQRWVLLVIMAALLIGCGGRAAQPTIVPAASPSATSAASAPADSPSPTLAPSPAPTPTLAPTEVPTVAAVPSPAEPLQSGGLGLTRVEWEQQHGTGTEDTLGFTYEKKQYLVMYQADPAGMETTWHLEQQFTDNPSIDDARRMSEQLLPDDRKLTKTYTTATDQLVDLYRSEWLKGRFPEVMKAGKLELPMWVNGEPGDFVVIYRRNATTPNKATSIVIGIGNNP